MLFGRGMVALAAIMTVVSLVLVERLARTYEDGLVVAQDSAVLVSEAVEPIARLANDLGVLADELAGGIDVTRELLGTTQEVLDGLGVAASTNLTEMATAAASISDRLAGFIETIERFVPGDADSLAEDLRRFADGLEPLAEQLADLGQQLTIAAAELEAADPTLAALSRQIDVVVADIDALGPSLDALSVTADDVRDRADEASTRLGASRWLLRLLVVLGGIVVATLGVVIERFARRLDALEPSSTLTL